MIIGIAMENQMFSRSLRKLENIQGQMCVCVWVSMSIDPWDSNGKSDVQSKSEKTRKYSRSDVCVCVCVCVWVGEHVN